MVVVVVVVDGDDGADCCSAVTDFRRKRYRRKKDLMLPFPIADSADYNPQLKTGRKQNRKCMDRSEILK